MDDMIDAMFSTYIYYYYFIHHFLT
jgi:hypothetical protein